MKKKAQIFISILAFLGISFTLTEVMFLSNPSHPLLEGMDMFRYFTIQSNFIVGGYFLLAALHPIKNNPSFQKILGGVMIYITITFFVYMILLEPIYSPQGLQLVGSILCHYITPILVIAYTMFYKNDYHFVNKDIKLWIIYPLVYLLFLLLHGLITNDYIYPFFQVSNVGVIGLIIVVLFMVVFFLIMSFLLVKILSKSKNVNK